MEAFRRKLRQDCCFLPKLVFKCLGISADLKKSMIYNTYSVLMIVSAGLYPLSNLHSLMHNIDDFDIVANAVFHITAGASGFLKIMVMLINRKRLSKILGEMEDIQRERNTEEWSRNEVYSANKKVLVVMVYFYISLFYFFVSTMIERIFGDNPNDWKTPFSNVSVIPINRSPNFEVAWVFQVMAVTIVSSSYCITDFLVAAIIMDLTLQFKIFRRHIEKVAFKQIQQQPEATSSNWPYLNKTVKKTVIYHMSLIDLATETEQVCSYLVFIAVLGSLCMICFSLYYASVVPPLDVKAMQAYLEVCMVTGCMFLISYCGTEISQASESISSACYESNFVGTDFRFQRSLIMIMTRSQKPVKLTVGKFTDLSIPVFVWILKSTYTYFMVLRKSSENRQIGYN